IEARSVAGNYDFAPVGLLVKNFKSYKDGEAKGGYKTYTWKSGKGAEQLYNFNFNYPDEAWRTVFRDVRFRRAMSVAINRHETNGPHPIHEMTREYWMKIGVQVDSKPVLRSVLRPKIIANQVMMTAWGGDEVIDTLLMRRPKWFAPHFGDEGTWAPLWGQWYV